MTPSVNAVRSISSIPLIVSNLLAQYEDQTQLDIVPGMDFLREKSGLCNITGTCTAKPELRWPNEGFVSGQSRKPTYDDLSLV